MLMLRRPSRPTKSICFAMLLLLASWLTPLRQSLADTIPIAMPERFGPYTFREAEGWTGIDVEIGQALYERMNLTTELRAFPWARQLAYTENGLVGGILTVYCDDEKPYYVRSQAHFYEVKIALFAHKNNQAMHTIDSLSELPQQTKVGVVRGNYYADTLTPYPHLKKVDTHRTEMLIPQLRFQRIDLALEELYPFMYYAKKLGAREQVHMVKTVYSNKVCTAFSRAFFGKRAEVLAEQASKEIEAMKQEGFIDRILKKYID